jgi:hypothetical protein
MRSKTKLKSTLSYESIRAINQETVQILKEIAAERKVMQKEAREMKKQNDKEAKEWKKESAEMKKQADKDTREMKEETRRVSKNLEIMIAESRRDMKELNRHLGGIDNSNGEIAEQYFYNAFKRNKTFVNENFDEIRRNLSYNNGVKGAEFDIVLFNGKSAALIEVKYNAKPDNIRIRDIISRVEVFKMLYPEYKNHIIYLGVAAMSFRKGLEQRLHRNGIATIRQVGKKMVVYDTEVKAF